MSDFEIGGPSCPFVVNAFNARNRLKDLGQYDDVVRTFAIAAIARGECAQECVTICGAVEETSSPDAGYGDLTLYDLAQAFEFASKLGSGCSELVTNEEVT